MTVEFINKNIQGNNISCDAIITTNDFSIRNYITVNKNTDLDTLAVELENNAINGFNLQENKKLVLSVLNDFESILLERAEKGTITLEGLLAANSVINSNLADIGIILDTPTLEAILKLRIKDSINVTSSRVNEITITNEIRDQILSVIQQVGAI